MTWVTSLARPARAAGSGSANRAVFRVEGMVVLREGCMNAPPRESIGSKGLGKKAARIAMHAWRQQYVRDLKPFNFHRRSLVFRPFLRQR
jgi:hypothetical protein